MKRSTIAVVVLSLIVGGSVSIAQAKSSDSHPRSWGLGVVLGEPTGLTAKFWLDRRQAIDVGLAFSFDSFVMISSDYLYHFPGAFGHDPEFARQLTPYIGVGGVFFISSSTNRDRHYFSVHDSDLGLGVRIPIGLEWTPRTPSIGVFVEVIPGVGFVPGTFGFVNGGIGIRYYF